jgi:general stress protein 26
MAESSRVNSAQNMTREQMVSKVGELIKDIKMAMLTTEAEDGLLHSRPMATQQTDFDGTLWFFTSLSSGKVNELEWNPEVNLSYAQASESKYVSISGNGEIVRDRAMMEELWNDIYKAWFPKGLEDQDLCLLKVEVSSAEYWEAPSGKMVQIFGYLKALATGERSQGEVSEHGTIDIATGRARGASSGTSSE